MRECHRQVSDEGRSLSRESVGTQAAWATGYNENTDWIAIPEATGAQGNVLHQRGVSPVPHLYLIGRSWQWTRGSALLTGVGDDAVITKDHIVKDVGEREQPERVVQILKPGRSLEAKATL